jgi:hypothetical protein
MGMCTYQRIRTKIRDRELLQQSAPVSLSQPKP